MESVRLIVGVILPYVALAVFLGGMIWRIATWKKLAAPPMTLFPAPSTEAANKLNIAKEAIFFKSLFHGDRVLWILAWTFHAVLLLIFLGHFRVVTGLIDSTLKTLGMTPEAIKAMSGGAGGAAGAVILLAVALLFVRRLTLQRAKEVTGPADYLALLLIGVVIITGNMMRFCGDTFHIELGGAGGTREYFAALATFSASACMDVLKHNAFLVHMCLALILIMLVPFSKILHFGGIFFTHQLVRKQ